MTVVLAVAATAVIVAVCTAALTRQAARSAITDAIGGRSGADPVAEHHRLVEVERANVALTTARSDLLSLALDAMRSGVIVVDADARELTRNSFARSISSRSHEQTLVDAAAAELLAVACTGEPVDREIEVFGPPPRMLFIHAAPIARDGEIIGALAVVDDVTEQHRIDATRRDFVANLSHELRTPVGAVSLLAEMLYDEPDDATRAQLSERIIGEAGRMTNTIDDLLELSRIESNTQSYDDDVVIGAVVDEAMARSRVAAEARGVHLGSVVPPQQLIVSGNHDQLVSAVSNLIENAVKYSDEGDTVSARVRVDDEALAIVVQDTGRGVPARDLDRIFERFYRVDRSRDSSTGGTGIGLSIVRHVALNHNGNVDVQSIEGEGSTFELSLPLSITNRRAGEAVT